MFRPESSLFFFQVLGVGTTEDGETVLVTADNSVLVRQMGDEDMIQTEYVVQAGFSPSKGSIFNDVMQMCLIFGYLERKWQKTRQNEYGFQMVHMTFYHLNTGVVNVRKGFMLPTSH